MFLETTMQMPDQPLYHVTVTFRQGYGKSFGDLEAALEYAELQAQSLLSEYEELEGEDFEGIYCEREGAQQYWRFDYEEGLAAWLPLEDGEAEFVARVGSLRQGGVLVLAPRAGR
jgi:hypothetical protein